ncbi:TPR-like protein [Pilatotrama ljubarskyi]|nr:TPR-like protein [Pilatotrama ljubarskyi]
MASGNTEQPLEHGVDTSASSTASENLTSVDTTEHIKKCLSDADDLKQEGNEHFRAKRWDEALASYRAALGRLPKRRSSPQAAAKGKARATDEVEGDASEDDTDVDAHVAEEEADHETITTNSELDAECTKARAVLNANIAACFMKLTEYKEVVLACTEALKDDPRYVKALQRRASANEQIGSWSSLSSAQEDYKLLVEILPPTSPDLVSIRRSLAALPPRIEAAQKRETAEMLDKLKGLGNSILGNFGLSTDNFQFVPNGQGGYSMNFVR